MSKSGWWVVLAAAVGASPCAVLAETWDRPPLLPHVGDEFARIPRQQVLVTGLRVGQVRIGFEKTRWSDLQRRLGPLRKRRRGDGAETQDWTCFTAGPANGRVQIWLDGGEMAGGEYIDGVIAVAGAPWLLGECPLVDPGPGPIALDSGTWIGVTRASLLKRLGRPTAVHGRSITYDYSVPVGEGAVSGRMMFETKANRVVRLMANKDTSY